MMKERTVGKETYSEGETVRLQNNKTKKWDHLLFFYESFSKILLGSRLFFVKTSANGSSVLTQVK